MIVQQCVSTNLILTLCAGLLPTFPGLLNIYLYKPEWTLINDLTLKKNISD